MDLRFTEMIVVSSCKSEIGKDVFGKKIQGIKNAITVSGAKSNILILGEIDDAAKSVFMRCFDERLKLVASRTEVQLKLKQTLSLKKFKVRTAEIGQIFFIGLLSIKW